MSSDATPSFDIDVRRRMGPDAEVALRFTAGPGLTALFGRSGAGKTSVLAMVAGLLRPDTGHVRVAGETLFDAASGTSVPTARRAAGYVFQDARLFPHFRVRGNLRYGMRRATRQAMSLDAVAVFLGIDQLLDRWPRTLSGGESFLVSLALALALSDLVSHKTSIDSLFLDEGFGTLDGDTLEIALEALDTLNASGKMIGVISHVEGMKERIATQIKVHKDNGIGYSRLII